LKTVHVKFQVTTNEPKKSGVPENIIDVFGRKTYSVSWLGILHIPTRD